MVQYLAIVGAFILGQTLDVIIQRPIEHAIDKIDEKFKISQGMHDGLIQSGKATQQTIEGIGQSHKAMAKMIDAKLRDMKKMYCYEIDEKGNIYKIPFQEFQDNFYSKDSNFFEKWSAYKNYLLRKNCDKVIKYKDAKYLILSNNSKVNKNIKYIIFSFKLSEKYIKEILELKVKLNEK